MERTLPMYNGKVYGVKVSRYGLENGRLDYQTLAEIVDGLVLNNRIHMATGYEKWELINGQDRWDEENEYIDVYQEYIISESGARFLEEYTDEIVYYNDELDVYLWGITHFGTAWSHVLTDIKLVVYL